MSRIKRCCNKLLATLLTVIVIISSFTITAIAANDPGMPTFTGSDNPVPDEPVPYIVGNMMQAIYDADMANGGDSFWVDRILERPGSDPGGNYLWSRGRALYMYEHSNNVIGFGGSVAYWHELEGTDAYSITFSPGNFSHDSSTRVQTPSHWQGEYNGDGINLLVRKFITHNNVAVTLLTLKNNNSDTQTLTMKATSPYTKRVDGNELVGDIEVRHELTTLYPRLSGDGMTVDGTDLTKSITLEAGESITTRVTMGFIAKEIPKSMEEYIEFSEYDPEAAFETQIQKYNQWWAENIPYMDVPDENIKKILYYRWWLNRFNYLDANIPGSHFQFPVSIEGVLGYNNAIILTQPMHVQDLKYLRDPMYSYGDWISAGETSRSRRYWDNPGNPDNWSNSYTQYLTRAALESYMVHGGPLNVAAKLAYYGEKDVYGQLDSYDTNNNNVIEYNWGAMTGNDADAVSFHWRSGNLDRAESAYVYGNARASEELYTYAGITDKANQMGQLSDDMQ